MNNDYDVLNITTTHIVTAMFAALTISQFCTLYGAQIQEAKLVGDGELEETTRAALTVQESDWEEQLQRGGGSESDRRTLTEGVKLLGHPDEWIALCKGWFHHLTEIGESDPKRTALLIAFLNDGGDDARTAAAHKQMLMLSIVQYPFTLEALAIPDTAENRSVQDLFQKVFGGDRSTFTH